MSILKFFAFIPIATLFVPFILITVQINIKVSQILLFFQIMFFLIQVVCIVILIVKG